MSDAQRRELITELELLKNACSGSQARVTVAFADSQVGELVASGTEEALARKSVGSQVALARREPPSRGDRHVGLSRALVEEMPLTLASVTAGETSEWRATIVVQGTATLSREDRAEVDRRLAPDLPDLGDRALAGAVRRLATELDVASVVARMKRAASGRRVTVRPAFDGMAYLTVLGPLAECVGAYAALDRAAGAVDGGYAESGERPDGRARAQVMADLALRLMSGRSATQPQPVEIGLVMTDTALLGEGEGRAGSVDEPALVGGPAPTPVPAAFARRLLRTPGADSSEQEAACTGTASPDSAPTGTAPPGLALPNSAPAGTAPIGTAPAGSAPIGTAPRGAAPPGAAPSGSSVNDQDVVMGEAQVWLRRLYTSPDGRDLVAMDSRRRVFGGSLRRFLVLRDKTCRTPWCDAPIRDLDHATAYRDGAATDAREGNGRCQRCNLTKEAPGWSTRPVGPPRDGPHELEIATPTGTRHRSVSPPLLGWGWHPPEPTARPHGYGEPEMGDPDDESFRATVLRLVS